MKEKYIDARYEVFRSEGKTMICGRDSSSGEEIFIPVPLEENSAREIAELLSENGVSLVHAKDIIRDRIVLLFDGNF